MGGFIGKQESGNVSDTVMFEIDIPNTVENGSLSFSGKIYSSNFANLVEAVEILIKDPYGCFEQTASVTYPMTMGL